jgi:hypothetical protein
VKKRWKGEKVIQGHKETLKAQGPLFKVESNITLIGEAGSVRIASYRSGNSDRVASMEAR